MFHTDSFMRRLLLLGFWAAGVPAYVLDDIARFLHGVPLLYEDGAPTTNH